MKRIILSLYAVIAVLGAKAADMSNSLELSQLYIIGDATPYAWNPEMCPDMEKVDEGVFRWSGHLEAGKEFKFLNTREFRKHIVATSAGQQIQVGRYYDLNLEIDKGLPDSKDFKFIPATSGDYTLYVDLRSMKMAVYQKEKEVELPTKLYATGTALGGRIVEIPLYGNVEFKALLKLQAGNLILQDTPTATVSTKYYTSLFDGVDISFGQGYVSSLKATTGKQVEGWSVSVPGKYTLHALKDHQRVYANLFKPCHTLYLVGGCLKDYWNYMADPTICQFVPSCMGSEELVWEGYLSPTWSDGRPEPSKLKILTAQDWSSETYHPYVADVSLLGEGYFRSSGGDDIKWQIYQAGTYRITVNTAEETIRGEFLSNGAKEQNATTGIGKTENNVSVQVVGYNGRLYVKASEIPIDVAVFTIEGKRIANCSGIKEGIVAEGLPKGVYVVKAAGTAKKIMMN